MKQFFTLSLALLSLTVFPQEIFRFEHTGSRCAIAKREALRSAQSMTQAIPNYPVSYAKMLDYVSFEMTTRLDGNTVSAKSESDLLTAEQKNILDNVLMGEEILVKIRFRYKDAANSLGTGGEI